MVDEQPDFPMSNKAFLYKVFVINPEISNKIRNLNNLLIQFYSERAQPQHLVWSTTKMMGIRAVGSEGWKNRTLINYKFEVARGNDI